ncbi:hypothetical protein BD413DRAFT_496285 [Trametes elegans]|nr:hypothetical protein BD413DRAFT_496285 [Trametes elegans]
MPGVTRVPMYFAVLAMLASADNLATLIEVAIPTVTDHTIHTSFLFKELADSGNHDLRNWHDSMDQVISALVSVALLNRPWLQCVFNCPNLDPRLVERFHSRLARAMIEEHDGIQELAASTSDMEAYTGTLRALTSDADDVDTNNNCLLPVAAERGNLARSTSPTMASTYQNRVITRAEALSSLSLDERAEAITTARAIIMAQLDKEQPHDVPEYAAYAKGVLAALLELEALGASPQLIEHAKLTTAHFLGDYIQPAYADNPIFEKWCLNKAATKLLAQRDAKVHRLARGDRAPPLVRLPVPAPVMSSSAPVATSSSAPPKMHVRPWPGYMQATPCPKAMPQHHSLAPVAPATEPRSDGKEEVNELAEDSAGMPQPSLPPSPSPAPVAQPVPKSPTTPSRKWKSRDFLPDKELGPLEFLGDEPHVPLADKKCERYRDLASDIPCVLRDGFNDCNRCLLLSKGCFVPKDTLLHYSKWYDKQGYQRACHITIATIREAFQKRHKSSRIPLWAQEGASGDETAPAGPLPSRPAPKKRAIAPKATAASTSVSTSSHPHTRSQHKVAPKATVKATSEATPKTASTSSTLRHRQVEVVVSAMTAESTDVAPSFKGS